MLFWSAPSGTRTQDPLIKRCIIFSYSTSFHSDITIFLSRTRYISFFLFLSFLSFYGINGQITVRIRGVFSLFLSAVFKNSCRNASTTPILWYALRLNDIAWSSKTALNWVPEWCRKLWKSNRIHCNSSPVIWSTGCFSLVWGEYSHRGVNFHRACFDA